jgi:hypothetical protein
MKRNKFLCAGALCAAVFMLVTGCANPGSDSGLEDNSVNPKTISVSDITVSGATTYVTDKDIADSMLAAIGKDAAIKNCLSDLTTVFNSAVGTSSNTTEARSIALDTFKADLHSIVSALYDTKNKRGKVYDFINNIGYDYESSYSIYRNWNDIQFGISGLTLSIPQYKLDLHAAGTTKKIFSGTDEIHSGVNIAFDPVKYVQDYNKENQSNTISTTLKDFRASYVVNLTGKVDSFDFATYETRTKASSDKLPSADELSAAASYSIKANAGMSVCDLTGCGGKIVITYSLSGSTEYETVLPVISSYIDKMLKTTPSDDEMAAFYDSLPLTVNCHIAFCDDAGTVMYSEDITKYSELMKKLGGVLIVHTGGDSVGESTLLSSMLDKIK